VTSAFLASEMFELEPRSESLTRSLLEGMIGKGARGEKEANLIFSFSFSSFTGPHAGLSQQGQRPKTVQPPLQRSRVDPAGCKRP
jgi:hypothetical protein